MEDQAPAEVRGRSVSRQGTAHTIDDSCSQVCLDSRFPKSLGSTNGYEVSNFEAIKESDQFSLVRLGGRGEVSGVHGQDGCRKRLAASAPRMGSFMGVGRMIP